ncbi:uncharacterized protein THITE_160282 [Thermothielavioides terrestris NRRL 8126]|uniref:Uncharacterized protein n=1 Tax=Thermothielavioides terrestris (strain ATCC 38088 / NRRL 8126) TaxID=578455 RepID=G2R808_THETT|nr:uncharacterized protein THITE_160282 [Thermothielavioides terrestris NRRL 8126]AEO68067.1 hypothetical protein THITE_160282 [Thermothielavioides terrestris NRRL 8126]
MRSLHCLFLALAGLSSLAIGEKVSLSNGHVSDVADNEHTARLGMAAYYPLPETQCAKWVGIEVIFIVDIVEVCPKGSAVTETLTECVATLTRSICATPTTNRPCYPCIMGTPPSTGDTVTVTVTSCSTATDHTITVTAQLCSTCSTTIYVGTVPGYTPGGPCNGCSPYSSGTAAAASSSTTAPCSESGSGGVRTGTLTTPTAVPTSECTESGAGSGAGTSTASPPGSPDQPLSLTSVVSPGSTVGTNTPFKSTTVPTVTAGGVRGVMVSWWSWVIASGVACVVLGR